MFWDWSAKMERQRMDLECVLSPFDPVWFLDLFSRVFAPCQVGDDISQAVKRFCHFCFSEEAWNSHGIMSWLTCFPSASPSLRRHPPCQIIAAKMDIFMDGTEAQRVYVSSALDGQRLVFLGHTQRCAFQTNENAWFDFGCSKIKASPCWTGRFFKRNIRYMIYFDDILIIYIYIFFIYTYEFIYLFFPESIHMNILTISALKAGIDKPKL